MVGAFLAGCGPQRVDGVAVPKFYGLFAIDNGSLTPISNETEYKFGPRVEFLLFDRGVALAGNAKFYSIPFATDTIGVPPPEFTTWSNFLTQNERSANENKAILTGIPTGATPIGTLIKPVPKQPEMSLYVPSQPLVPGLYQFAGTCRFWVNRRDFQMSTESSARQAMGGSQWENASRFARIALAAGVSSPEVTEEMNDIKDGSLVKGANQALERGNFQLAEAFASKAKMLSPPSKYLTDINQLLSVSIPFEVAMKTASDAAKSEDWDAMMQSAGKALALKTSDPKAIALIAECPKILIPRPKEIGLEWLSHKVLDLRFSSDSKRLVASIHWEKSGGAYYTSATSGWNVADRSQIDFSAGHFENWRNEIFPRRVRDNGDEIVLPWKRDLVVASLRNGNIRYTIPMRFYQNLAFGCFGNDRYIWTLVLPASTTNKDLEEMGVTGIAERLGFRNRELFAQGMYPCALVWDLQTSAVVSIIGFPKDTKRTPTDAMLTHDGSTIILYEAGNWGEPDRLSAWNVATSKLISLRYVEASHNRGEVNDGRRPIWTIAPDDKHLIIFDQERIRSWDWVSNSTSEGVALPPGDAFVVAFDTTGKRVAVRSSQDPYIRIVDTISGEIEARFREGPRESVVAMAFSPDGRFLATALDRQNDFLAFWRIDQNGMKLHESPTVSR
jgi:WD40 repeat protein